jgi:hypothetical protein
MSGHRGIAEVRTGIATCPTWVETDRVPSCKPAPGVGSVAGRAIMQILLSTRRKVLDYNDH